MKQKDQGEVQDGFSRQTYESDDEAQFSDPEDHYSVPGPPLRERVAFALQQNVLQHDMDVLRVVMHTEFESNDSADDEMLEDDDENSEAGSYFRGIANEIARLRNNTGQEDQLPDPEPNEDQLSDEDTENASGPDTKIRSQFQEYCDHMKGNHLELSKDEETAIRLLDIMRRKKTPLNAYDSLMAWHFKQRGWIKEHETAADSSHYISRKTILNRLTERYNAKSKFPYQRKLILPASGTVVKVSLHDTGSVLQRLLTDPRIEEDDYLFFDDDPRAGPPDNMVNVSDLITGQAYLDTHKELIGKDGNQQLLGIPMYIDGAAVSQFHHMEIVAVKISLSLFTREARMKDHTWGTVGYIEKVHKHGRTGEKIRQESNHMEFQDRDALVSDLDPKDAEVVEGVGKMPLQDWHAMVKVILEGVVMFQETGLMWDLPYKGKVYRDLHYLTFVPFIKCDNKEADAISGRFNDYSKCQQICRCCHILTQECDDHLHKIKYKTVLEIQKLVKTKNKTRLKEISYHYLTNAFHDLRFSLGNGRGVHGSCPSEMLHQMLLGVFSYLREILFTLIGPTSELAEEIDALSKLYCDLFRRQSDRTLPQTSFSKGLRTGHLMAKEFRGILLVILTIFRSTKGREALARRKHFKEAEALDDWILLVETMLQWEAYLNEKEMCKKHLQRLKRKNRYIMWLTRKIANRTKGMGLKLIKFHAILHAVEDIIQFGIPTEFDTGANESHHKDSKQAAKLTQRSGSTFNFQVATRLVEFYLLDLGIEELDHGSKLWEYYLPFEDDSDDQRMEEVSNDPEISTGETGIKVFKDIQGNTTFKMLTRSKFSGETTWIPDVIQFLFDLQVLIQAHAPNVSLPIYTRHTRDQQIFRGHPNYRGKGPWNDWAWVDWGSDGKFPCQIWCFVVLEGMPTGRNAINYGGCNVKDGTYAVVETGKLESSKLESNRSEILQPFAKEVGLDKAGKVTKRNFFLADTDAILGPCAVVPDIGGPPNRYFVVQPRAKWVDMFIDWLKLPHNQDEMTALGEEEEEEEEEEEVESSEEEATESSSSEDRAEESDEDQESSEEEEE